MLDGLVIKRVELSEEACSDILETAIEAGHTYGFGYWADLLSVNGTCTDARTTAIRIKDRDSGKRFTVSRAKLQAAILSMLQKPDFTGCRGIIGQLLQDDGLDGPLAEAIIQVACFGSVIYG